MFNWDQDPARTERAIQMLLKARYPGLRSFDGSGGDGGRDAELVTADGRTVFEVKSFGRLDSSRRRQVAKSLTKAVQTVPDMTRWVLAIPMNMTPTRPGARSSEQAWFEETLPKLAPGVDLDWFGRDWLDAALAKNMDVQRYIEGPESQLLQRAAEFGMETAVLADGASNLDERLAGLQRRVDEVSPYWTLDFAVRDGVHYQTLRAKRDDAPVADPIVITPTFTFRTDDADDEELRAKFEHTLAFGGHVDLPAGYMTDIDIEASPEARKLFDPGEPATSEFSLATPREVLDRRIRCSYQVLGTQTTSGGMSSGDENEHVLAQFSVFLAERTAGSVGVTLYGSDAAGVINFELGLPRPPAGPGQAPWEAAASLRMVLPETLVGFDIDSLRPVIDALAAASEGARMRLLLPQLGHVDGPRFDAAAFPEAVANQQLVTDLHHMQEITGSAFTYPANITNGQVKDLRRAVRLLDGDDVEHDGGFTLHVRPDGVSGFLDALLQAPGGVLQGGLFSLRELVEFNVGDLNLVYGPSAFWAPRPRLANLDHLQNVAAGKTPAPADDGVPAEFVPTDVPFRWMSREKSAVYLESGEQPSESDI